MKYIIAVMLFASMSFATPKKENTEGLGGVKMSKSQLKPTQKNYADFLKSSVKITNEEGTSGGTGWVLKSENTKSYIVTNRHVCNIYKRARTLMAHTHKGSYQIERIKMSDLHDLCLAEVYVDLEVETKIADKSPELGERITTAGHPRLFPMMITEGVMSGNIQVSIVTDIVTCDSSKESKENLYCALFGAVPVIKSYESRMTSAFIAGGNSGSAVFNSKGEVIGVVFAGSEDGYSQSIIVPLEFLSRFINEEEKDIKWNHISKEKGLSAPNVLKDEVTRSKNVPKNLAFTSIVDEKVRAMTRKMIESQK